MSNSIRQKLEDRIVRYAEIFRHRPRTLWVTPAEMHGLMEECPRVETYVTTSPALDIEWEPGEMKFEGIPIHLKRPDNV